MQIVNTLNEGMNSCENCLKKMFVFFIIIFYWTGNIHNFNHCFVLYISYQFQLFNFVWMFIIAMIICVWYYWIMYFDYLLIAHDYAFSWFYSLIMYRKNIVYFVCSHVTCGLYYFSFSLDIHVSFFIGVGESCSKLILSTD